MICGQTYLGVANHQDDNGQGYNIKSIVYRVSGSEFISHQEIPTQGAADMTSFEYKGHTYLAIANARDGGKFSINSVLYEWKYS